MIGSSRGRIRILTAWLLVDKAHTPVEGSTTEIRASGLFLKGRLRLKGVGDIQEYVGECRNRYNLSTLYKIQKVLI